MKKKIVAILLAVMSTMMLFGCGAKGTVTTENGEAVNVEISEKKVAKADTVSEFFGKGKHYACRASGNGKSAAIYEMFFFEDGKVTVLPGKAFGWNVGDLAQMSDDDIWKKYEEVRESYKNTYLEEHNQMSYPNVSTEDVDEAINILNQVKGLSIIELEENPELAEMYFGYGINFVAETFEISYDILENTSDELAINDVIEQLNKIKNPDILPFKGPFYDQPVKFIIESDQTGNATQKEFICMPSDSDYFDENGNYVVPTNTTKYVCFFDVSRGGMGGEIQIYDKNFFYFDGAGDCILTTETIQLDGVKSKDVVVDPDSNTINELFRDVIDAR